MYWAELTKRFSKEESIVFFESKNKNLFRKEIDIKTNNESVISFKILRYLPFLKKLPKKSIFHSSYYRVSFQKDIVNITTVHDFTYEYFRSGLSKYIHVWQKGFAIKRSDGIICVSENTKKDLIRLYPMIEEHKIRVIYNGLGDEFVKLENPNQYLTNDFEVLKDKKYILYVGDRSSYKNFDVAIDVLRQMLNYYLVVVGGKEFDNVEKENIKEIKDRVYYFGGVSRDTINKLYSNAFCLFYPSSYEGFGMPISEAMKAGCPVVSTNISSIPEVAGEAALLVDEIGVAGFIGEIKKLEDSRFRDELINKGLDQAKKFSWDKCFRETYGFYQEVWNRKFGE